MIIRIIYVMYNQIDEFRFSRRGKTVENDQYFGTVS